MRSVNRCEKRLADLGMTRVETDCDKFTGVMLSCGTGHHTSGGIAARTVPLHPPFPSVGLSLKPPTGGGKA